MDPYRIVVRAVFAFAVLHALLRASGKRTLHESTAFDFVLALIIGDMVDDILWADVAASRFAVAVGTLALVHTLVSWAVFRSPTVARLVDGDPALVVEGGSPRPPAMRREHVSEPDLEAFLREAGMPPDARRDIRQARLELSGELSVLKEERARAAQRRDLG